MLLNISLVFRYRYRVSGSQALSARALLLVIVFSHCFNSFLGAFIFVAARAVRIYLKGFVVLVVVLRNFICLPAATCAYATPPHPLPRQRGSCLPIAVKNNINATFRQKKKRKRKAAHNTHEEASVCVTHLHIGAHTHTRAHAYMWHIYLSLRDMDLSM